MDNTGFLKTYVFYYMSGFASDNAEKFAVFVFKVLHEDRAELRDHFLGTLLNLLSYLLHNLRILLYVSFHITKVL